MKTFDEFLIDFGFPEYPFSTFTTENEKGKEKDLFIKPNDFSPIIQSFNQSNTIILIGDRGTGKTAILLEFERLLEKQSALFCVVDDFSSLKYPFNSADLYKFLISKLSIVLFDKLSIDVKRIKKLSKEEKVLLSYMLKNFLPLVSKRTLKERIEKIQIPLFERLFRVFFNNSRGVLNYTATAGGKFIDEYLAKHYKGVPSLISDADIKEFFPELPLTIDDSFNDLEINYQLLNDTLKLIKKLDFERIVILLDKVDEDSRLENNGEAIADFISPVLTDNKLLLNKNLQLIFSMWSTPFNYLLENVRTQKHYCPKINWTFNDLEKALNKRIKVYSNSKKIDFKKLFHEDFTDNDFNNLFVLSNGNPRDLWHLMDKLLKNQYRINPDSTVIENNTIKPGIEDFITNFNYFEYYPRKLNAKANSMDFYSYTAHLLKLNNSIFTRNQLSDKAGTGGSTQNYVTGMERIGLIVKIGQESGVISYRIKDPKVVYALENNIKIER